MKYDHGRFYGEGGVIEPAGEITTHVIHLDNLWFETQLVNGKNLQKYIKKCSEAKNWLILDQFRKDAKDQIVQLSYVPGETNNPEDGSFVGLSVDNREVQLDYELACNTFSELIIKATIEKTDNSRCRWTNVPPGESRPTNDPSSGLLVSPGTYESWTI